MALCLHIPIYRDGLNELYAASRKQLNSEIELRQVHNSLQKYISSIGHVMYDCSY